MIKKTILLLALSGLLFSAKAQSSLSDVLLQIEKNNPELKANAQFYEAQNLEIKSGNLLSNPEIEWEKSFASAEGKPYEVLINQRFDFPLSYWYKHQINQRKIANTNRYQTEFRRNILLQAKLTCLELIYVTRQEQELEIRLANAKKLYHFFQQKLEKGDANILELNKVKMLKMNTQNQLELTRTKRFNLLEDLCKLNGGKRIELNINNYPQDDLQIDQQSILEQGLSQDAQLQYLQEEQQIASKEISLAKTNSLPKFSIGYRYLNSDITKEANGVKLGISIPLWENKYKVKQARLKHQYRKESYEIAEIQKKNNFLKLFRNYQSLKTNLQEYQQIFSKKRYNELLKKALDYGEISGIEYLTESIYYYDSYDTYLSLEYEYHKTIAQILKYRL